MLRGDWDWELTYFKIIGLLVVGLVTASFLRVAFVVNPECQQAQAQYYAASQPQAAENNKVPSEQEKQRDEAHHKADLCAQERMAKAAEYGLVLLLGTLYFTAGAFWAAWKTLVEMSGTAERQLRAYVVIEDGAIRLANIPGGYGLIVDVRLINAGNTPGYDFTTWFPEPVIDHPDAIPFTAPMPIATRTGKSIIGPGIPISMRHVIPISNQQLESIRDGLKRVFAWGGADYVDAFGRSRFFHFRCRSGHGEDNPAIKWPLSPHTLGYGASEQSTGNGSRR